VKSQIAELLGIYLRTESRMEVKLEFDHIQRTVIQTSGRAFIRTLATLSELHVLHVRPRCDVEDLVRTHARALTYTCVQSRTRAYLPAKETRACRDARELRPSMKPSWSSFLFSIFFSFLSSFFSFPFFSFFFSFFFFFSNEAPVEIAKLRALCRRGCSRFWI